jgi:type I restriction enzyme S subunit
MDLPEPPEVPSTWTIAQAGELQEAGAILDIQDGNHGGDYPRKAEFGEEGVPFVTAMQMRDGLVDVADAPRLDQVRASRLRIGFARGGDVLLTHNASVGDVALAPLDAGEFLLGTSVTYWRCNPEAIDPLYLYYFMQSSHFQDQLAFIMKQTTRNQVSVLKQVNLWICMPPLPEQHEIAKHLRSLQELVTKLNEVNEDAGAGLDALLPSLLDREYSVALPATA